MTDHTQYPRIPLKRMDAALLSFELLAEITSDTPGERDMVVSAAQVAALLHEGQTRQARGPLERTPYIEHPMRVALRLRRWGLREAELTAAALLHDTVEDCSARYASQLAVKETPTVWLARAYSDRVAATIQAVTNETAETAETARPSPKDRKDYTAKIEAIASNEDDWPLLVKASDMVDNAGSLSHQYGRAPDSMVRKLVTKYSPALPVLREALVSRGYEIPAFHLERVETVVYVLSEHIKAADRAAEQSTGERNERNPGERSPGEAL